MHLCMVQPLRRYFDNSEDLDEMPQDTLYTLFARILKNHLFDTDDISFEKVSIKNKISRRQKECKLTLKRRFSFTYQAPRL